MPDSIAYQAGFLGAEAQHTNWASALAGGLGAVGRTVDDVGSLITAYQSQQDEKITRYASMLLDGTEGSDGQKTKGLMELTYESNINTPDGLYEAYQLAWNDTMTADVLMGAGVSRKDAERWLRKYAPEMKAQYDLTAQRIESEGIRNRLISTEESRQKLILNQADTWQEAEEAITAGYESAKVGNYDNGTLSLGNLDHRMRMMGYYAEIRGKKYIEEMSSTSSMTFDEMVGEVLKVYDEEVGKSDFSGNEKAHLYATETRQALEATLREYAVQEAGNLTQEAQAKAVRFQNELTERRDAGEEISDDLWDEMVSRNFEVGNIYDQEAIRGLNYSQFGYDRRTGEEFAVVNAIMADENLPMALEEFRSAPVDSTTITVYEDGVDSALSAINSDSAEGMLEAETVAFNTRYGSFIQQKADEYGLNEEQTRYLARSLNQYASTSQQWASDRWKKILNEYAANPSITTEDYHEYIDSLYDNGVIDSVTHEEFYDKKGSQYQQYIDRATDRIKNRIDIAFSGDDDYTSQMRWKEITYRNDFINNLEQMIVREKTLGASDQELDAAIDEFATGLITVLQDNDVSDMVYKSVDEFIESITGYNPLRGFSSDTSSLQELNEAYLNSEYSAVFNENAVATGTLYLQGSPTTRTGEGLYDAVAKALYGNSAEYDNLTPTEKEIVKANGGVALAQFVQYEQARRMFEHDGLSFRSVNVTGYGMAAIDNEGFIYMPQGGNLYRVSYIMDPQLRKSILDPNNTTAVIDAADPRITGSFWRQETYTPPDDGPADPITADDPFADQLFGFDTSMQDRPDPSVAYRIEVESRPRYLSPYEGNTFRGIKAALKARGRSYGVQR